MTDKLGCVKAVGFGQRFESGVLFGGDGYCNAGCLLINSIIDAY